MGQVAQASWRQNIWKSKMKKTLGKYIKAWHLLPFNYKIYIIIYLALLTYSISVFIKHINKPNSIQIEKQINTTKTKIDHAKQKIEKIEFENSDSLINGLFGQYIERPSSK